MHVHASPALAGDSAGFLQPVTKLERLREDHGCIGGTETVHWDRGRRNSFAPIEEATSQRRFVVLRGLAALELESVEVARPIAAVDLQW